MSSIEDQLRYSRSARDILEIFRKDPDTTRRIMEERNINPDTLTNIDSLEAALDAERRRLIHENERRLARYLQAASQWADRWKSIEREINHCTLLDAHRIVVERAEKILPFTVSQERDE